MASDDGIRRMTVLFSGRVQGVGFRYTACRIADRFQVAGFVRNLMNGDVEVVAEGLEQELLDFLNAIRTSILSGYIINITTHFSSANGNYKGFGISS